MKLFKGLGSFALFALSVVCLSGCSFGMRMNYVYKDGDKYTAGDRQISEKIDTIDIDYMSGDVELIGADTDIVDIKETSKKQLDDKRKVHTWVDGTTLHVRYCKSANNLDLNDLEKHLKITIPEDVKLNSSKVDVSSGDVTCSSILAENVDVSASSGDINVECEASSVIMDASSGDIRLNQTGDSNDIALETSSGSITANIENATKLTAKASSGDITLDAKNIKDLKTETSSGENEFTFDTVPANSDITASSGNVTIYLPENTDLTAEIDSNEDVTYDLAFSKNDKTFVCGTGANHMKVETSSGEVSLKNHKTESESSDASDVLSGDIGPGFSIISRGRLKGFSKHF